MLSKKEALKKVFKFVLGHHTHHSDTHHKQEVKPVVKDGCKHCGSPLLTRMHSESDFLDVTIFQCTKCKMIYEKQINKPANKPLKDIYIYDQLESNSSEFSEIITMMKYKNYSLNKLWVIENIICYPVLVQSDFTQGISLIFVPYFVDIIKNDIEGYMLTEQNSLGYTKFTSRQKISFYTNPYLSRLPYPSYKYISFDDDEIFNNVKSISNIRYDLTNTGNVFELKIIYDIPYLCYGINIYAKFIAAYHTLKCGYSELLKDISFSSLLKNNTINSLAEGYAIKNFNVNKFSATMSSHVIEPDIRNKLAEKITRFFELIDKN